MRFDDYVCFNCSRALVETSPGTWECEHCGTAEKYDYGANAGIEFMPYCDFCGERKRGRISPSHSWICEDCDARYGGDFSTDVDE